jgi:hypothetical protein
MKQIIIFLSFLFFVQQASSQNIVRITTEQLLSDTKKNNASTLNNFPDLLVNFALPLIDSATAVELALIPSAIPVPEQFPQYRNAVGLQLKNYLLKQALLKDLLKYDSACTPVPVTKNDYENGLRFKYEYPALLKNALLKQIGDNDTVFLEVAKRQFEFWGPHINGFYNTVAKPGFHQLTIRKTKFEPCLLAGPGNGLFWIKSIYLITGKTDYGSTDEQLNKAYRKLIHGIGAKKDPDDRPDFTRRGKTSSITLGASYSTLDSLDFEKVPDIKEKIDRVRKENGWKIIIYTHNNKGLILLNYITSTMIGFSKENMNSPTIYLLDLTGPSTLQITNISYRERYY